MNVLFPKITPKTPFWGTPFNAKPIIQRALRQSYVNGVTTLKLYSYIGTGKYLGVSKFFRFGASGGTGSLNVNLGPPLLCRKLLELES